MNRKTLIAPITMLALSSTVALAPLAAFAEAGVNVNTDVQANTSVSGTNASVTAGASGTTSMSHSENSTKNTLQSLQRTSEAAVDARIAALKKYEARIASFKNLSDSDKAALTAQLSTQIDSMTALRAKLAADTTAADLKADAKTIAPEYRIYALVIPEISIIASADRALASAASMSSSSQSIAARIAAAKAAGKNTSAADAAYADYQAKVTDAQAQAHASISGIANLKPDNGDKTIAASNAAALKASRAQVKAAEKDLAAARKDVKTINSSLKKVMKVKAHQDAAASTTVSH